MNIFHEIRYYFNVDEDTCAFSGIVYNFSLKRKVRIVYIENYGIDGFAQSHAILFSTDLALNPEKILLHYKQRFQIDFLFRDVKNDTGLEHCQARSTNKINFHVNVSLTTVYTEPVLNDIFCKSVQPQYNLQRLYIIFQSQKMNETAFQRWISKQCTSTNISPI